MYSPQTFRQTRILLSVAANPRGARTSRRGRPRHRRGAAAVLAMLFLVIMAVMAVGMVEMAGTNSQGSVNLSDSMRAQGNAESGLRWFSYRLTHMARPKTTVGNITGAVAGQMWNTTAHSAKSIKQAIIDDWSSLTLPSEQTYTFDNASETLTSAKIKIDGDSSFQVSVRPHPLAAGDPLDARYLRVTSTGTYNGATRSVSMDFRIQKKIDAAIVGKVPIQIGRNTVVEGPVAMTTANKFPPLLMLSDFMHFDPALKTKLDAWNAFLQSTGTVNGKTLPHHNGYDNRISVNNAAEYAMATQAGYTDYNGDAYIDEYDLFVKQYDKDGDKAITKQEFTNPSTSQLYDASLFALMDSLNGPLYAGDTVRSGYNDGVISNEDGYAKVRGSVSLATSADAWANDLSKSGQDINDMIQGTIVTTDPMAKPVTFGADPDSVVDLDPANFEQCAANFKDKSGTSAGSPVRQAKKIENTTLSAADTQYSDAAVTITNAGKSTFKVGDIVTKTEFDAANAALAAAGKTQAKADADIVVTNPGKSTYKIGDIIPKTEFDATNSTLAAQGKTQAAGSVGSTNRATEKTPYGSTTYQATYRRPVFKNVAFKNVIIPKGLNAVFDNCTFEGVTYVEGEHDIKKADGTVTYNKDDGMSWAQRKIVGDAFTKDKLIAPAGSQTALGQTVTEGSKNGNNLRFNNCTFNGPLAGNYATAYTHFANTWEFTGATKFDNKWVDPVSQQTTATIVSPQVNIEMGSFTDPNQAPSTLKGVVVAGNIDIRGSSMVDGSIIVTGDGAGNTTLAYFGASDADTNAGAMPEGGYGKLLIRYNPYRALPDGINLPIQILPDPATYREEH